METEEDHINAIDDGIELHTTNENNKEIECHASPLSIETNSQPISTCSTPTPTTPIPSPFAIDSVGSPVHLAKNVAINEQISLPKLRLNITLASDPALQPEAKDIKCIRANAADNYKNHPDTDDELHEIHSDEELAPAFKIQIITDDDERPPPEKIRRKDDQVQVTIPNKAPPLRSNVSEHSPRIPTFICAPCGIKFSSLSTLEAHQTYYCSHK